MNKIKVGHFEQDGGLINLPLGFIPDYIRLVDFHTNTNIDIYEWWRSMETDQASGKQEGFSIKEGVTANLADAGGITAYDTGSQGPQVGIWEASNTTIDTKDGTTLTVVARSATSRGTYLFPTTDSSQDRDAIFECVTAGTTGSTEPTWPDAIGEQVTDNSMVWERVDVSLARQGYQGVVLAAALTVDGQEMYYLAFQANQRIDHGDVAGWVGGVDPDAN